MSSQKQFEELLQAMRSENSKVRKRAEHAFTKTRDSQPAQIAQALLQVGRTTSDKHLRAFALVTFRTSLSDGSWAAFPPQIQTLIKTELLLGLEQEADREVLIQLREATVEIAEDILGAEESGSWPELFNWIFSHGSAQRKEVREVALGLFAHITMFMTSFDTSEKFGPLRDFILAGLKDGEISVRLAALTGVVNCIQIFTSQGPRTALRDLLPLVLETIAAGLNAKLESEVQSALKTLIDITEVDAGFLKHHIAIFTDAMFKIAHSQELDDEVRQLAVEVIVSLVEHKPSMCLTVQNFTKNMLECFMSLMMEIDDVPIDEWNAAIRSSDAGDEAAMDILNNDIAQQAIDRVSVTLQGDVILPVLFEHVPKMLADSGNWITRHVALMALSMSFEGCKEQLFPHLAKVVEMIVPSVRDPNPRVRWAAINALGQMATDFGPKFQRLFHGVTLPLISESLADFNNPKILAHACAFIVNFCEFADAPDLSLYLGPLLQRLLELLKFNHKVVQEQCITAIASLAGAVGDEFVPYAATFLPLLREILVNIKSNDLKMLKCKCMECISIIGISVGKEIFSPYSKPFIDFLASIDTVKLDADDPQREFVLQAWSRVSSILGKDFVPYLNFILPPILTAAQADHGVTVHDEYEEIEEEKGWEIIEGAGKRVRINTAGLEEKSNACNLLYCYAAEMKASFYPYVDAVSKVIQPLLNYFYHDGVRLSCFACVSHLLNSVKLYGEETKQNVPLMQLFNYLFPAVLESIREESDREVLAVGLEAVHEALNVMGKNVLSQAQVKDILRLLHAFLLAGRKRRSMIMADDVDGDAEDSVLAREAIVQEDNVNRQLSEVIGVLVREHPDHFFSSLDQLGPLILEMLNQDKHMAEKQFAICAFDDMAEHGGAKAHHLYEVFMPQMMKYAFDSNPALRQACLFGLGVCVTNGPATMDNLIPQLVEVLWKAINAPTAREGASAGPTENAISSFGKIIKNKVHVIKDELPKMIDTWVNWLPIEVDLEEGLIVNRLLMEFLQKYPDHVIGPNFKNVPQLLKIFARSYKTKSCDDELNIQFENYVRQMQSGLPGDMMRAAFESLPESARKVLAKISVTNSPAPSPSK